jgi:hypothetical protein
MATELSLSLRTVTMMAFRFAQELTWLVPMKLKQEAGLTLNLYLGVE